MRPITDMEISRLLLDRLQKTEHLYETGMITEQEAFKCHAEDFLYFFDLYRRETLKED